MPPRRKRRDETSTVDMLLCQTIGHTWYPVDAMRRPRFGILWRLRCDRCTTTRDDLVDHRGYLLSRSYDHPEGYRDAHLDLDSRADRRAHLLADAAPAPNLRIVRRRTSA